MLDLFFDCPAGAFQPTVGTKWFGVCGQPGDPSFGVPGACDVGCPGPELRGAVESAIRSGGIAWHAFPSNNEPEAGDAALTRAAIDSVHLLDDRFGLPHKTVVSQRDVPGVTRGIVPLLAGKGVVAFSEGKNTAVANPAVPSPIFNWTDLASGTSVIFMNHYQGYGAAADDDATVSTHDTLGLSLADTVTLRGFDEALVFAFRGDNGGPQTQTQVESNIAAVKNLFPNATVTGSTLDAFVSALLKHGTEALPVVTSEIGDTWIYGLQADPKKTQVRLTSTFSLATHFLIHIQ